MDQIAKNVMKMSPIFVPPESRKNITCAGLKNIKIIKQKEVDIKPT